MSALFIYDRKFIYANMKWNFFVLLASFVNFEPTFLYATAAYCVAYSRLAKYLLFALQLIE